MVTTRSTTVAYQNNNQQDAQPRKQSRNHHRGSRGNYRKYSQEIRDLAIRYFERMGGMPISKAAEPLGVKRSTLSTHVNLYRQEGRSEPKKRGRRKGETVKFNEAHQEFLRDTLDQDCTKTLDILKEELMSNFPDLTEMNNSTSGVWRFFIKRIGYTLARTKAVKERRNTPETINAPYEYVNKLLKEGIVYNNNCIFVDEAGFNANLIRGFGYSKKGSQNVVSTQSKRALNISILAGILYHGIENVSVKKVKGGTIGEIFKEFIQGIIKRLDDTGAGSYFFVMDNTSIHKTPVVKELSKNS